MANALIQTTESPPPSAAGTEPDDALLVVAAQGDRLAFAPLYRRYVDPIFRYCRVRLGDKEAAEDATSLVFARALAGIGGCRPASFRSWLFAIAHNTIANEFRHRAAHPVAPWEAAKTLPDPRDGPEALALAAETRRTVADLLAYLPDDQRRVVELRLAGLTGPEIARVLGRDPGGVRVAQHRAIIRLRRLLAATEPSDLLENADD